MALLINKSAVKKLAVEFALERYPSGKFKRVSGSFVECVNEDVRTAIKRRIDQLPTVGKTIK